MQNLMLVFVLLDGPRHCKVGDWGEWSPCSKSCGIGESIRSREILRHPKRGGQECPSLNGKIKSTIFLPVLQNKS